MSAAVDTPRGGERESGRRDCSYGRLAGKTKVTICRSSLRMTARYAIYYAPEPGSPLDRFGAAWLGRSAWTGEPVAQPAVEGLDPEQLAAMTAEPRLYGFHGTLKPPF